MEKQTPIPSPHPLNQGRSKTRLFPIFDLGGGGSWGGGSSLSIYFVQDCGILRLREESHAS